jgi:hypothetical protein
MGFEPTELRVLDLGYRWASLSDDGSLNMHWQAMALPPSVIDYLFVHELAHAEPRTTTARSGARSSRPCPTPSSAVSGCGARGRLVALQRDFVRSVIWRAYPCPHVQEQSQQRQALDSV